MEKLKICNILDFDGVLVPGEILMDEYIKEFCYKASNEYCDKLFKMQSELVEQQQLLEEERNDSLLAEVLKELEELDRKIKQHFVFKDQVLEESEPQYQNKINYADIYRRENVYPGVLEVLWEMYERKVYDLLISDTHVNSKFEILRKQILLESDFPPMLFFPVFFHLVPFYDPKTGLANKNRKPSDKVGILLKEKQFIIPEKSTLIDNSKSIIKRGNELGVRSYFVEKNLEPYIIANPTLDPIPSQIILDAANDTIDLYRGNVKKLSL
jgi:hypothetical protein